jgi:predicted Zn-dependent protease
LEVERLTNGQCVDDPVLLRLRARLAISRHDLPAACRDLRAAVAADPHDRVALFQLGDLLAKSGEIDEGRRYLTAAKKHDTLYELIERLSEPGGRDDPRLLATVADASLQVGLRAEARAWYLLALQLDPSSPETQRAIYRLDHEDAGKIANVPALHEMRNPNEPGPPTASAQ